MGDAIVKFDDRDIIDKQDKGINIVLKARCETVVRVPTNSAELKTGLISKTELLPGIYMAETLRIVREGGCLTSIVNTTEGEVNESLPIVKVEEYDIENNSIQAAFVTQGAVTREGRLTAAGKN
jgi:hypothetical protein